MTLPDTQSTHGMFSGSEVSELCDSIKDIHRLLKSMGDFFAELDGVEDPGGNGLQIDFKRWGIRTLAEDLVSRQHEKLHRIMAIYTEEQLKMTGVKTGRSAAE